MNKIKLLSILTPIFIGHLLLTPAAGAEDTDINTKQVAPQTQKGAWVIPQGKLYTEIYNKYYWHKSQFDNKGKEVDWAYGGRYSEFRSELKLEYGLTDKLTILAYLPFKEARWKDDFKQSTTRNLVDIWSGAKFNLFTEPFVFTLQGRLKFPTNYNPNHTPALGKEQIDGDIQFLFGKSLSPLFDGYAKVEFGFRARDEEPTNEIPYFCELGYNLLDWLTINATIDGIEGLQDTGQTEEDYTKWNAHLVFEILNDYNLKVGYGETFSGKYSSAAQEIILALSTQF